MAIDFDSFNFDLELESASLIANAKGKGGSPAKPYPGEIMVSRLVPHEKGRMWTLAIKPETYTLPGSGMYEFGVVIDASKHLVPQTDADGKAILDTDGQQIVRIKDSCVAGILLRSYVEHMPRNGDGSALRITDLEHQRAIFVHERIRFGPKKDPEGNVIEGEFVESKAVSRAVAPIPTSDASDGDEGDDGYSDEDLATLLAYYDGKTKIAAQAGAHKSDLSETLRDDVVKGRAFNALVADGYIEMDGKTIRVPVPA